VASAFPAWVMLLFFNFSPVHDVATVLMSHAFEYAGRRLSPSIHRPIAVANGVIVQAFQYQFLNVCGKQVTEFLVDNDEGWYQ